MIARIGSFTDVDSIAAATRFPGKRVYCYVMFLKNRVRRALNDSAAGTHFWLGGPLTADAMAEIVAASDSVISVSYPARRADLPEAIRGAMACGASITPRERSAGRRLLHSSGDADSVPVGCVEASVDQGGRFAATDGIYSESTWSRLVWRGLL